MLAGGLRLWAGGVGLRAGTRGVCRRADRLLALFPHAGIPLPSSGCDPPKGVCAPQLPRQAPQDAAWVRSGSRARAVTRAGLSRTPADAQTQTI